MGNQQIYHTKTNFANLSAMGNQQIYHAIKNPRCESKPGKCMTANVTNMKTLRVVLRQDGKAGRDEVPGLFSFLKKQGVQPLIELPRGAEMKFGKEGMKRVKDINETGMLLAWRCSRAGYNGVSNKTWE